MVKVPRPGFVKTRLCPIFSDVQLAELSKCFLLDAVAKADRVSANLIIAFTPDDGKGEVADLLRRKQLYISQTGSDLGERIKSVIANASSQGFGPLVFIGTDSPTLPLTYIQTALEYLAANENGVAIGPTDDGGYYLIGISRPHRALFSGISWSTSRVFEQTISNAKGIPGVQLLELPCWYDVDEPVDIMRLNTEFEKDEKARIGAPETFRWLASQRESLRWAAEASESFSDSSG